MPKACDVKKNQVIEINNQPYIVKNIEVHSPSSRGAQTLYKMLFNQLKTRQKHEQAFKGDEFIKEVDFFKKEVQYSYNDGDFFTFMDNEDYSQYSLPKEALDDQLAYIPEGLDGIIALFVDDELLAIELPQSVIMEVIDTSPEIKGASATGRTKPATLSTGLEVQVPEYIKIGEKLKINTETGKFMCRG
ncbi:MAG: elongation factor P-like protein YeiP [Methylococcales bacterium]|jgi:elongation factor P|nr:elongation factor P-like protein YeiP [Methylococcales bacterium]MBT7410940.1 elongation factor P-like protein YeiP [Methylococcales bacterium]